MDHKTAVTAVTWIPAGKSKLCEDRMSAVDAAPPVDEDRASEVSDSETPPEVDEDGVQYFSVLASDRKLALEHDPHVTVNDDGEVDKEDQEYYTIKDSDMLFVAANAEDDACTLEVYLYDTIEGGMYVHHDVLLGSYPLALAPVTRDRNLCAVGSFDSCIEIWDLDSADTVTESVTALGLPQETFTNKRRLNMGKKKKKPKSKDSHTDAVLTLHASPHRPEGLASGSADNSVRVWDVNTANCVATFSHHKDKVQCVRWHNSETAILMTAGYDKRVCYLDVRAGASSCHSSVALASDPEYAMWLRHCPSNVVVACENGEVVCMDFRATSKNNIVWTLHDAHSNAVTCLTDTSGADNLMVTCSLDGEAKLWDIKGPSPKLVYSRALNAGPLFSVSTNDDDNQGNMMLFGGTCPVLWDLTDTSVIRNSFPTLPGADEDVEGEVRRMEDDNDDDDLEVGKQAMDVEEEGPSDDV